MWYKLKRIMMRPNGTEKQIRPSGWKPWANTIAYYKFDWNLNDSSGNNNNWTWYNWAWAFTDGTVNLGGSHAIALPFTLAWLTNWTFNIWIKISGNKEFNGILGTTTWTTWTMHINYIYQAPAIRVAVNQYPDIDDVSTLTIDNWYNIIITKSWTTYNIFNNWVLNVSWTSGNFTDNSGLYLGTTYQTARCLNWYLSNAIFEDKTRTSQEVLDYYNLTKSNYWL